MDIIEQIEKWGNKNAIHKPFENAVCYPLHSKDFVRIGFCEICPTLSARDWKDPKCVIERSNMEEQMIVAMRGRNPDNPSDRTKGIETEQRLEPQQEGICNTLTSVQKDNLVLEPKVVGGLGEKVSNNSTQFYQQDRVYSSDGIAMCLPSSLTGGSYNYYMDYKIRKLTPRECYRLMGFTDEEFDKAAKVNSSTQLYKQAGNSIVVDVLVEIFKELILSLEGKSPRYKEDEQMSLFDYM